VVKKFFKNRKIEGSVAKKFSKIKEMTVSDTRLSRPRNRNFCTKCLKIAMRGLAINRKNFNLRNLCRLIGEMPEYFKIRVLLLDVLRLAGKLHRFALNVRAEY
jgi:hypothetical protein